MKRYIKDGKFYDGFTITVDTESGKRLVCNPTEEMLLENGYVEWVAPEPTAEERFAQAKQMLIDNIRQYDNSNAVNSFTINN